MTQHRMTREQLLAGLNVGLRPKLTKSQVRDLGLAHIANLDTISRGTATEEVLWQWVGGALTWSYVASSLERRDKHGRYLEAGAAMRLQLEICTSVVERYGRTGKIGFSGPEYLTAKEACEWMDALAAVVDRPTAVRAADMSELRVNAWAGECLQHATAGADA